MARRQRHGHVRATSRRASGTAQLQARSVVMRRWRQRCHHGTGTETIVAPATATVVGAVGRRADRRPSGTAKPRQGHGGHGQPVRGHTRAHGTTARRRGSATRGDHAHGAGHHKAVTCTNFKALITTKPLLLNLNRLHYTQDGIWNY